MLLPLPSQGSHPFNPERSQTSIGRRGTLELARIYVSASTFAAALELLDRLPPSAWDDEARLLRAEAFLGLRRLPEADALLGPPLLPTFARAPEEKVTTWKEDGEIETTPESESVASPSVLPRWERRGGKRKPQSKRERLALWRFLLQLRVLHHTGRYYHVVELGRAFFSQKALAPSILAARIATIVAQSMLALRQPASARGLFEEILELYNRLRSTEGSADTLLGLANSYLVDCHWDEADALYQEARYRYEEIGQSDKALAALVNLGVLRAKRGDLTGGRSLLLQALTRSHQLGETRRLATIELGLGLVEMRSGAFDEARRWLLASLRRSRRSQTPRFRALALENLGEMLLLQGRTRRARLCLGAGLKIARQIAPDGDLVFEIRRRQAEAALMEGSIEEARVLASEARRLAQAYGDPYEAAAADRVLAGIELAEGNPSAARGRAREAVEALNRLGESYERARLILLQLRSEDLMGVLPPQRLPDRLSEICQPFTGMESCVVLQEARRLAGGNATRERPRSELVRALEEARWNLAAASRILGLSRRTLYRRLRAHGLARPGA